MRRSLINSYPPFIFAMFAGWIIVYYLSCMIIKDLSMIGNSLVTLKPDFPDNIIPSNVIQRMSANSDVQFGKEINYVKKNHIGTILICHSTARRCRSGRQSTSGSVPVP